MSFQIGKMDGVLFSKATKGLESDRKHGLFVFLSGMTRDGFSTELSKDLSSLIADYGIHVGSPPKLRPRTVSHYETRTIPWNIIL